MNVKQVLDISDSVFGKGYMTDKEVIDYKNDSNATIITIERNNHLVGFSVIQILSKAQLNYVVFDDVPEEIKSFSKIGYRKMTAVNPNLKSKGIGQKLFKMGQEWFTSKSVDVVLTVAWVNEETKIYRRFLEKHGFKPIKNYNEYWKEDSLARQYDCAVCGTPPCKCDGVLYAKKLKS